LSVGLLGGAPEATPRAAESERTGAGSPYLVNICRGRTFTRWSRHQSKVYGTVKAWLIEKSGSQIFWFTLTSANNGRGVCLADDFKELLKRVKRDLGYKAGHLIVQTREGHGVIHGFFAIKQKNAAFIPIAWLRAEWESIHGAWNCSIRRVSTRSHKKNVAGYIVRQYIAGQDALDRVSYDWWSCKLALGKGWSQLKRLVHEHRVLYRELRYGRMMPVYDYIPWPAMAEAWQRLLKHGWCDVDGWVYRVVGRDVLKYGVTQVVEIA